MAKGVNKVIIVGNLGNDPEMKYTASGAAIANISVATSESWNDKQTGEKITKTEWHRITAFGRLAEIIGEYVTKGSQVYIEGRLQTDKWQDQNGQDRYATKIIVGQLQMLGGKQGGNQRPAQSGQGGFRNKPAQQPAQNANDFQDDDIPF